MVAIRSPDSFAAQMFDYEDDGMVPKLSVKQVRTMTLKTLSELSGRFKREYGKIVVCSDAKKTWRLDYFPYYKWRRRQNRDVDSKIDWENVYEVIDAVKAEVKEYLPYKFVHVDGCEADDVIGTLVMENSRIHPLSGELETEIPILIISSDKDFKQLHRPGLKQYDPVVRKDFLHEPNPKQFLEDHILKGDADDDVPNIYSDDNCFVVKKRQSPMTEKRLDSLRFQVSEGHERWDKYERNKTLIDLSCIPDTLQSNIKAEWTNAKPNDKTKLMMYLASNAEELFASINNF
jgi:hypothetical protein